MSVPGKTFELLALPTHVLAMVPPEGDTARIVQAAGAATVTAFEDQEQAASVMQRIIADHFSGRLDHHRDWAAVDRCDRAALAADFAACLDHAAGRRAAQVMQRASSSDIAEAPRETTDNPSLDIGAEADSGPSQPLCHVSI
jgi:hypothetical protein